MINWETFFLEKLRDIKVVQLLSFQCYLKVGKYVALGSDREPFLNIRKTKTNYIFSERSNID